MRSRSVLYVSMETISHGITKQIARLCLIPAFLLLVAAPAAPLPNDVASLLKRQADFSDDQIAAVGRGDRVVQMLKTNTQTEVAFVAVSRLSISLPTYLERVRAGSLYRTGDVILQYGRFSETPNISDLKDLHFESFDLSSTKDVQQTTHANKEQLLSSIREYEKSGAITVGAFGAQPKLVDRARQLEPIVKEAGYLQERMPAAYEYLLRYPNVPKRGSDDFFIWKQMTFGFRPLTRVAQVSIWEDKPQGRREAIVLMNQIYANRYFQASFQIDHLVSDDSDPLNPAVYLISINRGCSQLLEGLPGKVIRPIVLSRTQATAEKTLDQARQDFRLEFPGNSRDRKKD